MNWWNPKYDNIIKQLPESVLKVLKKRIETTKIRGKHCKLDEECWELEDLFEKELETYKRKKLRTRINNIQQQEIKQDIKQENKLEIEQKELITQEKEEEINDKDKELQRLKEEKESAIKKLKYLHDETVYKFESEIRYLKEQIEYYQKSTRRAVPRIKI